MTEATSAYDQLTPKQQRFVDHYLETGNATEAARLAGYSGSDNTLRSMGGENLLKPAIASAIKERQKDTAEKRIASGEEVLKFLSGVMLGTQEASPQQLRAAELLGKRWLLWKEREGEDLPELGEPLYTPGKKP